MDGTTNSDGTPRASVVARRRALQKLGLGVAVAYAAPTILHLDRSARAVSPSCNGGSKGNPWCKTSGGKGSKGGK